MTISHFELKILRYIGKLSKRSHRTFSNAFLCKKFGEGSQYAINSLYKNEYIDCPCSSINEQNLVCVALPIMDNWQITDKGLYCVAENKLVVTLTAKERLFNFFLGFGSGVLSGCIVQLFIRLIQSASI